MAAFPASGDKRRLVGQRLGVLVAAAVVVFGLLGAFGFELIHSQGESRRQAERSFQAEARITAELTSSLFGSTVSSATSQVAKSFGGERISDASLAKLVQQSHLPYALVVDGRGGVLAASAGTPAGARLRASELLAKLNQRPSTQSWLSNLSRFRTTSVVEWALPFQTAHGERVLVEAIDAKALTGFLGGYLKDPAGSAKRAGYIVDGNSRVIADSTGKAKLGDRLARPAKPDSGRYGSPTGERYAATAALVGSDWRVVLTEPTAVLYPALAGSRSWIVDGVLIAFALVALASILFLRRMLISSERVRAANRTLNELNATLEARVAERTAVAEHRADELARSNSELEQFASVASHDLQEPLRKIRMYCGRLPQRLGAGISEEGASDLSRIQNAAERMQQLIDDLLSFARVSSTQRELEPVPLNDLITQVLGDLEGRIESTAAKIEVGDLPVVMADRLQMGQLLQNLLSNALKFHREGVPPEIRITGVLTDAQPARFDGHRAPSRQCVIAIEDNGIGFDPKYTDRIFSAFERLHSRTDYEGTGIGLSIARKIAWRHRGDLTATSTPGEGSTFTLTLPLPDAAAQPAERAA